MLFNDFFINQLYYLGRGGFRGGGADAFSSGIRPPADPKGPSFGTF